MKTEQPAIYQIKVQGKLNQQWSDWLAGMAISHDQADEEAFISTLTGPIVDQAALRGTLNRLWDLNLALLSVRLLDGHLIFKESTRAALTNNEKQQSQR